MYGMMGGMEKTTVYLTPEQKAALAQAARAGGLSEATLIREGVDAVTARRAAAEVPAALAPSAGGTQDQSRVFVRPRWIDRAALIELIQRSRADAALTGDLRDLAPDSTDHEPLA